MKYIVVGYVLKKTLANITFGTNLIKGRLRRFRTVMQQPESTINFGIEPRKKTKGNYAHRHLYTGGYVMSRFVTQGHGTIASGTSFATGLLSSLTSFACWRLVRVFV